MKIQLNTGLALQGKGKNTRVKFQGNPFVLIAVLLLLSWLLIEVFVAFDFMRDRYGGYEGEVVDIHNTWIDWLSMDFMPVEHLIIQTETGSLQDRLVTMEVRTLYRIKVGDNVVKEQGFSNYPRVPGKDTVQETLGSLGK